MLNSIIKSVLKAVAMITFRVKKIGEENIPDGPCILCGNHINALDAPVAIVCMKRKVCFMAKEELFKSKFIKYVGGEVLGVFPVKRDSQDIEAIKKALSVIKKGDILGIFPEGTRNGMAKNAKIKNGAAFFAVKTGVPIIPVGIQGSFKPFSKVKFNFGKPLDFSQYKSKKPEKPCKKFVDSAYVIFERKML